MNLEQALERIEELERQLVEKDWLLRKRTEAWQLVLRTTKKLMTKEEA